MKEMGIAKHVDRAADCLANYRNSGSKGRSKEQGGFSQSESDTPSRLAQDGRKSVEKIVGEFPCAHCDTTS
uniref:SFRICE_029425 n=1 Tax=Spodoptera frugiperda TaxID=7108 RepID=A0A2H1W6T0_SPOFR